MVKPFYLFLRDTFDHSMNLFNSNCITTIEQSSNCATEKSIIPKKKKEKDKRDELSGCWRRHRLDPEANHRYLIKRSSRGYFLFLFLPHVAISIHPRFSSFLLFLYFLFPLLLLLLAFSFSHETLYLEKRTTRSHWTFTVTFKMVVKRNYTPRKIGTRSVTYPKQLDTRKLPYFRIVEEAS